ncbi:phosphatidylinositide phosphatase sac2 [Plakobranchus ocellatus]|uniref:Phosphatidylinositide phosphatase sac2 n=1 Tax=Plakobranchus ocellatus TaxID=259542 RepID=A0AAV3YL14_9GAST|nr:phosphatidylinositide phosphatase sac2 [Plakobranchus ocellatus]
MLIVEPEHCLGAWGLINATPGEGDSDQVDMDMILLLSQRSVYVCWYDDEEEQVNRYQRIYLEDVDKIEIGETSSSIRGFSRLFNNKATTVQSAEEVRESLRLMADTFRSAQEIMSIQLEVVEKPKLDRRKALPHPEVMDIHQQLQENSLACIQLPRDVSTEVVSADHLPPGPTGHPLPATSDRMSAPSGRPKSPLDFFSSLPKPNLTSAFTRVSGGSGGGEAGKPSTNSSSRFLFPKPNIKVNFQNMGVVRRFRDGTLASRFSVSSGVRASKGAGGVWGAHIDDLGDETDQPTGIDVPDGSASSLSIRSSRECPEVEGEPHAEVVMDGCGILASSPKQVLLSSIQLKAEGKHRSSLSESPVPPSPPVVAAAGSECDVPLATADTPDAASALTVPGVSSSHAEPVCVDSEGIKHGEPQTSAGETTASKDLLQNGDDSSTNPGQHEELDKGKTADSQEKVSHEDTVVIETEDVREILSRFHQLHHPLMKTSHSDTSLDALGMTSGARTGGIAAEGANVSDSGLMSRLKLKMTNLSRPLATGGSGLTSYITSSGSGSASRQEEGSVTPVHTKTHIRKSQRAMDVFEQMLKEKLPSMECKSRYIFI